MKHSDIISVDTSARTVSFEGKTYDCAIGKNGVIAEADKREGDNKTPLGRYPLRYGYYREDKLDKPESVLDMTASTKQMGWCDALDHPDYNKPVTLPFDASHETLWRDQDDCYDIVVVLGHNDTPPISGMGSAIFMHVAKKGYSGTEGCVALTKSDLVTMLQNISKNTIIEIF